MRLLSLCALTCALAACGDTSPAEQPSPVVPAEEARPEFNFQVRLSTPNGRSFTAEELAHNNQVMAGLDRECGMIVGNWELCMRSRIAEAHEGGAFVPEGTLVAITPMTPPGVTV